MVRAKEGLPPLAFIAPVALINAVNPLIRGWS
jgi:hypothetical protein